jgi:hypothetical protein
MRDIKYTGAILSYRLGVSYNKPLFTKTELKACLSEGLAHLVAQLDEVKRRCADNIVRYDNSGYYIQQIALVNSALSSLGKFKGEDLEKWNPPGQVIQTWKCAKCSNPIMTRHQIGLHSKSIGHKRWLFEKRNPNFVRYGEAYAGWLAQYTNVKYTKGASYYGCVMYVNKKYIPAIKAWQDGLKNTFEGNFTKYMKTTFGRLN